MSARVELGRMVLVASTDYADRDHFTVLRLPLHTGGHFMGWGAHVTLFGLTLGACWL